MLGIWVFLLVVGVVYVTVGESEFEVGTPRASWNLTSTALALLHHGFMRTGAPAGDMKP